MGFFKNLSRLFSPAPQKADDASYWIQVQCNRCGEVIHARVDLRNDLSIQYSDTGAIAGYYCRKVLMGSGRCYQQIEVELSFGPDHRPAGQEIHGGKFVSAG